MNVAAFGRPDEAGLVDCLRASDAWVDGLSLVASEPDGTVIGHLLLSRVDVVGHGEQAWTVLSLAPMAVRPDRQSRGVGSALVEHALALAEDRGERLVVVLGHAAFYPRFGFLPASRHGIVAPWPVPDEVYLVRSLAADDPAIRGRVRYPACFDAV